MGKKKQKLTASTLKPRIKRAGDSVSVSVSKGAAGRPIDGRVSRRPNTPKKPTIIKRKIKLPNDPRKNRTHAVNVKAADRICRGLRVERGAYCEGSLERFFFGDG